MEKATLKGIFAKGTIPAGTNYTAVFNDILQTFPYFQIAQILLAKQMYDTHEPEASARIKLASVYAPDRKAMYHLFKTTDTTQLNYSPATEAPQKVADKHENAAIKYNFVYTSSTTTQKAEVPSSQQKTEVAKQEPTHTETFIRKELETKLRPAPVIEKAVEVDVVKTGSVKPPADDSVVIPVNKPIPPIVEKKVEQPYSSAQLAKVTEENEPEKSVTEEVKPEKEIVQPIKDTETPVISLLIEPISDSNLKYSFSSWLKVIPEISISQKAHENTDNQQKKSDIIDTFLAKLPSISRPKAEFFSPDKAAKMSITEDDTIVSETLAKIHFEQGNLQKALNAYQTLLAEFPEKKNIFAPRIEKIKTLMRENTKPATK